MKSRSSAAQSAHDMRPAHSHDVPPAPQVLALKLTRRPVALASTLAAPGDQPLRSEISPMDAECFRLEVTALLAISGKGATSYSITGSGSGSIRSSGSGGSIVGPPLEPLYRAHGFAAEAGGLRGFIVMGPLFVAAARCCARLYEITPEIVRD